MTQHSVWSSVSNNGVIDSMPVAMKRGWDDEERDGLVARQTTVIKDWDFISHVVTSPKAHIPETFQEPIKHEWECKRPRFTL